MTYKASLDKTAITITLGVTFLFALIIGGQYAIFGEKDRAHPAFTTTACLLIYLLAFAFRPIRYVITKDEVIISRPLKNVHIKRKEIAEAVILNKRQLAGSFRIFGVGGLFGYYGRFSKYSIGSMTWYATHMDRPVLITTNDRRKIILTPDDPLNFVAELNS